MITKMDNNQIILTPDQEELIENLEQFLNDNRCYFGVYGPAGSGKSFTISYFINKNNMYEKILLSGTTNNACRVLEQSLETQNGNMTIYTFIEKLIKLQSEMNMHIKLIDEGLYNIKVKECLRVYLSDIVTFINTLKQTAKELLKEVDEEFKDLEDYNKDYEYIDSLIDGKKRVKDQEKIMKCLDNNMMNIIKNKITEFIEQKCNSLLSDKLYIKHINNIFETIFYKNRYIRTLHSLLGFEQCRDENHNVVFLPGKSNIKETKTKSGTKYEFTPKLTGKRKAQYDSLNSEQKKDFEKEFYSLCFAKLTEKDILIIDESSMMKEIEFRYIIYICKIMKLKVIFLGDKYQLPPVDDKDLNTDKDEFTTQEIDFSPAVKLKSSYTLSTIKRTSNPVLQQVYKTYRDLVERTSQGKVKLHNIQYTINIQPTDKYLMQNKSEIQNVIDYIKLSDPQFSNTRVLCFSNKEVNMMNTMIRRSLYGINCDKYVVDETLLVLNYMYLPSLNTKQLILIESIIENQNLIHLNYLFQKITDNTSSVSKTSLLKHDKDFHLLVDAFKEINNKENQIKLYTSCAIKVLKIVKTKIYMNNKNVNTHIIFFSYENFISLFFVFENHNDNDHVKNVLKQEKQLIKLKTDTFKMHVCNGKCDKQLKKHVCDCDTPDTCVHQLEVCEKESCTLVCQSCYECNPECIMCIKQHRNHYSTQLWNKFVSKEYLLEPSVNYSYATTVHKSQGQSIDNIVVCEYNIVNCVLYNNEVPEFEKMLIYPTCMYTAVTRAKNILVRLK